nr:hypothetical protein [Tanacetum cinerariifolium]
MYKSNSYINVRGHMKRLACVGLAPNSQTSVQISVELEISALQSGRTRSELVNEPSPPSVPPTKAQLSELFYPLFADDDEVAPTSNVHSVHIPAAPATEFANGSPSTTVIQEDAPAITDKSQTPPPDTSVVNEENLCNASLHKEDVMS